MKALSQNRRFAASAFMLLLSLAATVPATAAPVHLQSVSFTQDWSRYPAPDVLLKTLRKQFPHAEMGYDMTSCFIINEKNQTVIGQDNPLTGTPSLANPNSAFLVWYTGCVKSLAVAEQAAFSEFYVTNRFNLRASSPQQEQAKAAEFGAPYASGAIRASCPLSFATGFPGGDAKCDWKNMPERTRLAIISAEIERLVGPDEVIREEGFAPSLDAFARRVDAQLLLTVTKNPGSLAFLQIYAGTSYLSPIALLPALRFLILLNDTLKY